MLESEQTVYIQFCIIFFITDLVIEASLFMLTTAVVKIKTGL